jgi:hypothetical protein
VTSRAADADNSDQIEVDDRLTGINFIEVLFALVVARTLEPIAQYQSIPAVGWSHLVVAGVLTIASWIGYHNSQNRPRSFIRFRRPLSPLWQFGIDVALVVVYWLTAISAEGTGSELGHSASARPETLLVAAAFLLYCAWDEVGLMIRRDRLFGRRLIENDNPARRKVTRLFALATVAIAIAVWILDPRSSTWIVVVDGILVIPILIGFRVAKDRWYVRPQSAKPRVASKALLDQMQTSLNDLRRSIETEGGI